jgi:hypothetical protein
MTTLDPTGAANRLLAHSVINPGLCLYYVGRALLQGKTPIQGAPNAATAWGDIPSTHRHGGAPPKDYPAWFSYRNLGDVALGDGNGGVVAVDTHGGVWHPGVVGAQTIPERERQLGGTYLGWSDWFCGYQIATPTPTPTPTPKKGLYDMFGFVRNPAGAIAIVNPATGHKRGLSYPEWQSYQINGASWVQLDDTAFNSIPNG